MILQLFFPSSGVCNSWRGGCIRRDQHPQHSRKVLNFILPLKYLFFFYNVTVWSRNWDFIGIKRSFTLALVHSLSKMGNRRTANVRSVGYSDLFSLSKVKPQLYSNQEIRYFCEIIIWSPSSTLTNSEKNLCIPADLINNIVHYHLNSFCWNY